MESFMDLRTDSDVSDCVKNGCVLMVSLALVKLGIHLLTNGHYGFHRDELYYLACGDHPSWGYVDHPSLTPWLAGLVRKIT